MAQKVFITGASSGIGAALARHYARDGATLGLVGRRTAELERLAAELGVPCALYTADVAEPAPMRAAAQDFLARHGPPDVVIANAGISAGTLGDMAEDIPTLERILRTNVVGLATTLQPFVESMRAARRGALVVIASVAGFRGLPGSGAYSASKSAAITWAESLRGELHGSGIDVVTICPGFIATPMTAGNDYTMPFLTPVDEFATRAAAAIARGRRYVVIPWQMGVLGWFLRRIPCWLYDRIMAQVGRKARHLPL